jgi:hypothetical protein
MTIPIAKKQKIVHVHGQWITFLEHIQNTKKKKKVFETFNDHFLGLMVL